MKDLSREELLEWLGEIKGYMQDGRTWWNNDEHVHSQIKALIQQPRKVGREWVEKIIGIVIDPLDDWDLPEEQRLYMQITDEQRNDLIKILKELDIEVEG